MSDSKMSIGVKLITDLKDFITGFKKASDTTARFGEEVEKNATTPLRAMEAQMRALRQTQRKAITPEEYQKIGGEIKKVQSEIDRFKGKVATTKTPLTNLMDTAKGLLPAFGFAAIAAGAGMAFNKVINATDTLATDWQASMNGMREGLNEFWRTLATGDWSNFSDRIKEAIRLGEQYTYTLDDIEDRTRSLSVIEADARAEELRLEEAIKNKGLSNADRLKAGQERIALEEMLTEKRVSLAQQAYDAEADMTAAQTKLSKEQLITIIRDMDSATKVRAKAYNEQLKQYDHLKRTNVSYRTDLYGGTTSYPLDDSEQMKALKKEIDGTLPAIKLYADQIRATGRTTDEQLEKMVASYVALKGAENSAVENTKKVRTQVNSLLAEGNEELAKELNLRQKIANIDADKRASAGMTMITNQKGPGQLKSTGPDTKTLGDIGPSIERNTERLAMFNQELKDIRAENINILADSFNSLGNSIGGAAGSFMDMVGTILGLIPTLISQIGTLTAAQVAADQTKVASSTSVTAAKGAEAIASGTASAMSLPPIVNIVALAATIGAIVSALATTISPKKYAFGGVVPGTSFAGDKVLARVNSGEEILKANDPRHKNNMRGGNGGNVEVSILNEAVIKGEDLYIMQKKVEKRISRRT